ncbi:hypothetical protein, partial [Corynebacterium freneyi]|uniref:hypothetical protein n=1 Tax=Corynebacterium freneyi TaxID=134034 RepID=UPI001E320B8C
QGAGRVGAGQKVDISARRKIATRLFAPRWQYFATTAASTRSSSSKKMREQRGAHSNRESEPRKVAGNPPRGAAWL